MSSKMNLQNENDNPNSNAFKKSTQNLTEIVQNEASNRAITSKNNIENANQQNPSKSLIIDQKSSTSSKKNITKSINKIDEKPKNSKNEINSQNNVSLQKINSKLDEKSKIAFSEREEPMKESMSKFDNSMANQTDFNGYQTENEPQSETVQQQIDINSASYNEQPNNEVKIELYVQSLYDFVQRFRMNEGKQPLIYDIGLTFAVNEYNLLETSETQNKKLLFHILKKYKISNNCEQIQIQFEAFENELESISGFEFCLNQLFSIMMESEEEAEKLLSDNFNAIGAGIVVKGNYLNISILLSKVCLKIDSIEQLLSNKLQISGVVLTKEMGVFFLRIVHLEKKDTEIVINPQHLSFDLETGFFTANVDGIGFFDSPLRLVEVYLRVDPENIKYGMKSGLNHIPKNLEVGYCFPLVAYPFIDVNGRKFSVLKTLQNSKNVEMNNHSKLNDHNVKLGLGNMDEGFDDNLSSEFKEHNDESVSSLNENESKQGSKMSKSLEFDDNDKLLKPVKEAESIPEYEFDSFNQANNAENIVKNDEALKSDLETALDEATRELKRQANKNKQFQVKISLKIKEKKEKDNKSAFLHSEFNTNEIKYSNSIDLISEIRKELKSIKTKYSQATEQMNKKLEEKTEKFERIRGTFKNLKNEVCRNAVFESSLKKIPPRMLEDLDNRETDTTTKLQMIRLEIIKMRMLIEKTTRTLARKEELADGLHLIDFEKLKIENQSLNEKIEERNEEIFKLVNKNVLSIHILAHVKEKLHSEQKQIEDYVEKYNGKGELKR